MIIFFFRNKQNDVHNHKIEVHVHVYKVVNRHHDNMSVHYIPPYTPLLNSKTGVYRVYIFFLFLLKYIDCGYPQSMF